MVTPQLTHCAHQMMPSFKRQHRDKHPAHLRHESVEKSIIQYAGSESRLVSLRHHSSVWLVPIILLALALFPLPYGYYSFLRLGICSVGVWIAYEQWRHDDAASGWVVALGAMALLYNPLFPISLTREIWSVLNLVAAALLVGHLWSLRQLVTEASRTLQSRNSRSGAG